MHKSSLIIITCLTTLAVKSQTVFTLQQCNIDTALYHTNRNIKQQELNRQSREIA